VLSLYLKMNHGGANSDDNENNNLGRIRLSVTSAADAKADPLPQNVRDILATPAAQRTPAQTRAVFAYWRTTVPEWRAENDAIAALWRTHPEGALQLVTADRGDDHRATHLAQARRFPPARSRSAARYAGVPASATLAAMAPNHRACGLRAGWWIANRPPLRDPS